MAKFRICVVVPAYNEEESLSEVIQELRDHGFGAKEIIVVDDGSEDNTTVVAKKHGVDLIRNSINIGVGRSVQKVCPRQLIGVLKLR